MTEDAYPNAQPRPPAKNSGEGSGALGSSGAAEVLGALEAELPAPSGLSASILGLPLRGWDTVAIILLTVVADICLYTHPGGTGGAVLLLVVVLGLLSLTTAGWRNASAPLMLTVLLLAGMSAWNHWWLAGFLGAAAAVWFAVRLYRPGWTVTEVAWAAPWTAMVAPFRLLGHVLSIAGYAVREHTGEVEVRRRTPLKVVLVPLFVTALFLLIFIAANPVVEKIASDISRSLGEFLKKFADLFTLGRMLSWAGWLLVFAALIRPHVRSWLADWLARREEILAPSTDEAPRKGDFATALATLVSVNVLFLAFNALDSVYLYFKAELPAGISYSEYSHRGCFWLTVALILSTAVIGVVFLRGLNFHPRSRVLRAASYIWAAQNAVLALGALRRLEMYIDYNGLTRARIVGLYGVLLVAVGLALMVLKVARRKKFMWLVRRDALALWVALVVLALTPRDLVCWRYNAAQAAAGNLRPLALLTVQKMSPESYPPLIRLLDHPDRLVREGIGGFLGIRLDRLRERRPAQWTEWQCSSAWAMATLKSAAPKIERLVPKDRWKDAEEKLFESVRPFVHTIRGWED